MCDRYIVIRLVDFFGLLVVDVGASEESGDWSGTKMATVSIISSSTSLQKCVISSKNLLCFFW